MFKNNLHSKDWSYSFLRRHWLYLSEGTTKNITSARAATNQEVLNNFFNNLEIKFASSDLLMSKKSVHIDIFPY